jgi:glycosyltransferase involved in cell wall biosynthesis
VHDNVSRLADPLARRFHVFDRSPSRSLRERRRLRQLAVEVQPEAVFTVFGPAYVEFKAPHLMGFAIPWIAHPSRLAYQTLPSHWALLRRLVRDQYSTHWLRQADRWVTESDATRAGMHRRLGIPLEHIGVVSNTCAQSYFDQAQVTPYPQPGRKVRLLCFSAAYPHKCIDIIVPTAAELVRRMPQLDFEFVVTLPPDEPLWHKIESESRRLGVASRIANRGPIAVADGPALYRDCHVCFMPTVLECFTATYPEAMAMGLPIVTSDLDFAHAICRDSAVYFRPRDAVHAAEQLQRLLSSSALWTTLVDHGKQVLDGLPKPRRKYEGYVELLQKTIAGADFAPTMPRPSQRAA